MENQHLWYLDNGCSKHMIGDEINFFNLLLKLEGHVKYGDNNKGIIGSQENIKVKEDVLWRKPIKVMIILMVQKYASYSYY